MEDRVEPKDPKDMSDIELKRESNMLFRLIPRIAESLSNMRSYPYIGDPDERADNVNEEILRRGYSDADDIIDVSD